MPPTLFSQSDGAQTCELRHRVEGHLAIIYPDADHAALCDELLRTMRLSETAPAPPPFKNNWSEADALVITYADSIRHPAQVPLQTLHSFLRERLQDVLSGVHLLPFFPSTADDGFAVSDYSKVDSRVGTWDDINALAQDFDVMADCVINHCSSQGQWFSNYLAGNSPGKDYFIECDPQTDLSQVVRPRTSPLLREVQTSEGQRHVWCTFSHDQVDLNFKNPEVLTAFVGFIRLYLDQGISIFRLDAVAFLWKQIGTTCLNLPETHETVRLLRTLVEFAAPEAIIITETNIPSRENLAYFGNANEAHLIYNFSLPPLLLYSLVSGNCKYLKSWLMSMPPAQHGTTYFNFIASHDGIGLRPAEGLLDDDELNALITAMQGFGGEVSWRALDNNQKKPYEINISLIDALQGTLNGADRWQLQRFLCAHTIMLALEGIPAFYIHSLVATGNDYELAEKRQQARSINRHVWDANALNRELDTPESMHAQVLAGLRQLIGLRKKQPAFHPNATQFTMHLGEQVFAFWRQSIDRRQSIFCLNNISDTVQNIALHEINLIATEQWQDLISGQTLTEHTGNIELQPYQCAWLANI